MTPRLQRILYLAVCLGILVLWIWYGQFEAVEAPYVRF